MSMTWLEENEKERSEEEKYNMSEQENENGICEILQKLAKPNSIDHMTTKVPSPRKYITRSAETDALRDTALRLIETGYPKPIENKMRLLYNKEQYKEVLDLALTIDGYKRGERIEEDKEERAIKVVRPSVVRDFVEKMQSMEKLREFSRTENGKILAKVLCTDEAKEQIIKTLTQKVSEKSITKEQWNEFKKWAISFMSEKWLKEIIGQVPGIEELDGKSN